MKSENLSSNEEQAIELEPKGSFDEEQDDDIEPKGSLIGLSGSWAGYLIHRFIVFELVAIFSYFLFTELPMILSFRAQEDIADYCYSILKGTSIPVSMVVYFMAIITSALLFDYLHAPGSATLIHSMPLNRGRLFRTSVFTGYILQLIPILVISVTMYIVATLSEASAGDPTLHQMFTIVNCLKWFIDTVVLMSFTYAVANFAGIIAGNTVMHVILAMVFESLPSTVIFLIEMYKEAFIYGSTSIEGVTEYFTPLTHYLERNNTLTFDQLLITLIYILVSILITVIAGLLYKKVQLERERSATVFPVVSDFLVMLFTFIAMSIFGLVTAAVFNDYGETVTSKVNFIIAAAVSGILAFIILRMIADGTPKIFTPKNILKFILFTLICAGIFAMTVFDIFGISKKMPARENVKRIIWEADLSGGANTETTLTSKASISACMDLHAYIIKNRTKVEKESQAFGTTENEEVPRESLTIKYSYGMKSGGNLDRIYEIIYPSADKKLTALVNKVISTKEYKESYMNHIERMLRNATRITVESIKGGEVNVSKDVWEILVASYMQDYDQNSMEYRLSLNSVSDGFAKSKAGYITIHYPSSIDSDELDPEMSSTASLIFGAKDKTVQSVLKENDLIKKIIKAEEENPEEEE